jgi:aminoglycoside/choline kinase family phosphotransferase
MNPDSRLLELHRWLSSQLSTLRGGARFSLAPASEDASFRRYFRVSFANGGESLIAMDAPPEKENCRPFLHVGALFAGAGAHVPKVHASNLEQGFLLLEDLGPTTYLDRLKETEDRSAAADGLYMAAIDTVVAIQLSGNASDLRPYDDGILRRELNLFPDWYVARHLRLELSPADSEILARAFELVLANNLAQPRVHVHRDYHSRNLMVCNPLPGVLDFQDALYGPITYDLASLLRDAYVRWEEERVIDWCVRYWEKARKAGLPVAPDFPAFYRDFEWMGVQRHLKVAGIFARLFHRDGKERYLADLPLVVDYLQAACSRYRELGPLAGLLDRLHGRDVAAGYTF